MNASTQESGLVKGLKARHLTMMAVGGVIGAGFFLGAGGAIGMAGPAVTICYVMGGLIAFLVMVMLTEMSIGMPVAGSFQKYATLSYGPWAGFLTGWTYWLAFLIGPASECIAAGTFLNIWFPQVPIWVFCLIVAASLTVVNAVGVAFFGEMEFWLSLIKVVALVAFIIWVLVALVGFAPESPASIDRLVSDGGFAPAGVLGVVGAMLLVVFSYGGTEAIGTAAEESEQPERDLPRVLRSTILRIVVLYVLSIALLVCVIPWRDAGTSSSPFVDAVGILGGPVAANIMNFVVLTAAVSCVDTGVFATSRMLYSLSGEGFFPDVFSRLSSRRRVPLVAIMASSSVLFVGVVMMAVFPDFAYLWLGSLSGFGFLFAWFMICLSEPRMRQRLRESGKLRWRVPGVAWLQKLSVTLIALVFVGLVFNEGGRHILLAGGIWLVLASLYYWAFGKKGFAARQQVVARPNAE